MGCMRLSTDADRDEERSLRTLRAAHDAGVDLFDTAAAYGHDQRDLHHGEALLRRALGDLSKVRVVTKCGMCRPAGKWVPDGRRKTILEDAARSCAALEVDALDLLLLHAPDPRTPFETSVRALRAALDAGLTRRVGVCNVTRRQLDAARAIVPIDAVQIAIGPLDEEAVRGGVVDRCRELGIEVQAHSPLGGPSKVKRIRENELVDDLAIGHGVTAEELVLAWLYGLGVVPLPGARTPEAAIRAANAARLVLRDDARALLDERFAVGRLLRTTRASRMPRAPRREVVLMMGVPAAGKTRVASALRLEGFARLSRDERGGSLASLSGALRSELEEGAERVVMDATYPSRAARNRVIETAYEQGASVRCVWLDTSLPDAQLNAIERMLDRCGALLDPEEIAKRSREDPNLFPPRAQHRYFDVLEEPSEDEGFSRVDRVPFDREPDPARTRSGLVVDLEAIAPVFPGAAIPARVEALRGRAAEILVVGWLPQVGEGKSSPASVANAFAPIADALGATLAYCPHAAGPPKCWCRRPLPGLVVAWMREHHIGSHALTYVGASAGSERLAEQLGAMHLPARLLDA